MPDRPLSTGESQVKNPNCKFLAYRFCKDNGCYLETWLNGQEGAQNTKELEVAISAKKAEARKAGCQEEISKP